MKTRTKKTESRSLCEGRCELRSKAYPRPVRGQIQWITQSEAYVVVPCGTAREFRQSWDATTWLPSVDNPDQTLSREVHAELVSAEWALGCESESEGLLLHLS